MDVIGTVTSLLGDSEVAGWIAGVLGVVVLWFGNNFRNKRKGANREKAKQAEKSMDMAREISDRRADAARRVRNRPDERVFRD